MAVVKELADAITRRSAVSLTYARDGGSGPRVVHPHVLYTGSDGRLLLDAYQVAGHSTSGGLPAWRVFDVEAVERVDLLPQHFDPAVDYNPTSPTRYAHVLVKVER
jgi:hypothetical protein